MSNDPKAHPSEGVAQRCARFLLEIEAVNFRPDAPYQLSSGLRSPVYIDCRKLISFPAVRTALMDDAAALLARERETRAFEGVAGGETAGIPFAAWIAERLTLPMQYVRKKPKGYGRNAQIEGAFEPGQNILLVEDLATDGGSKLNFVGALRAAGATVTDIFVIFYYDIFPQTRAMLADDGVQLHALCTWRDVLAAARQERSFDEKTLASVEEFLAQPLTWSSNRGGAASLPALQR